MSVFAQSFERLLRSIFIDFAAGDFACGRIPNYEKINRADVGCRFVRGIGVFVVEDGVIKGEGVPSTCGINTFLMADKKYGDLDFKVEFLCESGNSGVQFRSPYVCVMSRSADIRTEKRILYCLFVPKSVFSYRLFM